jgi:hypothetical protein
MSEKKGINVFLEVRSVYFMKGRAMVDLEPPRDQTNKDIRLEDNPRLLFPQEKVPPEDVFCMFVPGSEVLVTFQVLTKEAEEDGHE